MRMKDHKRLGLREFQEEGFLQEINRKVLHPCGLAMALGFDDEDPDRVVEVTILDHRDDPEGILFDVDLVVSAQAELKAAHVDLLRENHREARVATGECLGDGVQWVPGRHNDNPDWIPESPATRVSYYSREPEHEAELEALGRVRGWGKGKQQEEDVDEDLSLGLSARLPPEDESFDALLDGLVGDDEG